jgi:hypothetical protein
MIWKSFWHMTSTELLTRVLFAVLANLLGSLGLYYLPPMVSTLAGLALFIVIYLIRYKRILPG